ncbi:hypothetical protein ES692_15210 [Psychroserpens burtonensis]|uniref:Uncharacterized protein n=1 Tax=Psychroserpens burtonensis TaxID=49278 RepID=A0A5C7BCW9_9FLAO|nr:hypothetical protein [Psychroserpens burtonensis]TXE15841.1 hypothetical protein ES692_15210 [Psychroserpens burtonensis]
MERGFLCGPGYHLEWELVDTPIRIFKKSGCESGFGLCFSVGAVWAFDCVRNSLDDVPVISRVTFDPTTEKIDAVAVGDRNIDRLTFYYHKDIMDSSDHDATDFLIMDIEDGVYISSNYKLVAGTYNRVINGDYYTYTVPYVDEN